MFRLLFRFLLLVFFMGVAVVQAGTVDMVIANSFSQSATIDACPGSTVTALIFSVTNNEPVSYLIQSMGYSFTGSGNMAADCSAGTFYVDLNDNGVVDPTDLSFSMGLFSDRATDDYTSNFIPANGSVNYIVTLTFNADAPVGKTYQLATNNGTFSWEIFPTTPPYDQAVSVVGQATGPVIQLVNCAAPTNTTSSTPTSSFTLTSTLTATGTPTNSPTASYTATPSGPTSTPTNTFTATLTSTMTATGTPTMTFTATQTPTMTGTFTFTPTFTNTVPTNTATLTSTSTSTPTITRTFTPSPTATVTFTYTPTTITQPVFSAPYPNPASTGPIQINVNTPSSASIRMTIFTVSKRRILDRTVLTGKGMGGYLGIPTTVSWDMKDEMGLPVANGLYYLRVRVTGNSNTEKIFKIMVLR